MRPKRPPKPPTPPPPIPAVVKPEDLDAINPPAVNKIPTYISPGKFQWNPSLPGPKGDKGDPGAITRPISPAVTADEIAAGAVTALKLATDSVETAKIKDLNVTTGKLAVSAVTQPKIAPNSVGWSELKDDSVQPSHIRATNEPVTGQVPAVSDVQYNFDFITPVTRPLDPPVATEEIGAGAVGSSQLAVDSVTTEKIQNGAVTSPKLGYKAVSVTIPALALSGSSGPDPELVGGQILGSYPSVGNALVNLREIVIAPASGAVSVSIWAAVAVDNTFNVVVLRG